jgi:hypothetical protein
VALVRVPFYFINLLPISLLYISILLAEAEPTNDPNESRQELEDNEQCIQPRMNQEGGGRTVWKCSSERN